MGRITLWGFYQYDNTLFDGVVLPSGIDKENLISEIMRNSGDLYPYHQVPEQLKRNITFWFSRRFFDFERMYTAIRAEYSPIENYDRMEDINREYNDSGRDTETMTQGSSTEEVTTLGSSTTTQRTGSDSSETLVSAYNDSEYSNRDKTVESYNSTFTDTGSGSDTRTTTGSSSDTSITDYGKVRRENENTRIHGNIGVTTAQQMITEEIELRVKYDIYRIIAREFEREFLVQIY